MSREFTIIIPARYASSRLAAKPLLDIHGQTLIQHVYNAACQCGAKKIYIATDDVRIQEVAEAFSATVIMTSNTHLSGTDRLAEVVEILNLQDEEIIVNLQGDEIGISPLLVQQVVTGLAEHSQHQIATLCKKIDKQIDIHDPNTVKVVFDQNNTALYFSRAAIPYAMKNKDIQYFAHIGLYAYRVAYLKQFSTLPISTLERCESLEQLRALAIGEKIYIEEASTNAGIGVDTAEDLVKAQQYIQRKLATQGCEF